MYGDEHLTIEKYINKELTKYVNDTGSVFCKREIGEKAETFIHFTWERSGESFMLLDLQRAGYLLCDPEIATIDLRVKEGGIKSEFYFCLGNLSTNAIHECNS